MLIKIWSLRGGANPREGANLREGAKPNEYGNDIFPIFKMTRILR